MDENFQKTRGPPVTDVDIHAAIVKNNVYYVITGESTKMYTFKLNALLWWGLVVPWIH